MEKTIGQIIDEINEMNDGSIMEIYKVQGGFKTKFQSGWSHSADEFIKENKTKPLFITEDGVEMMHSNQPLWEIIDFEKVATTVAWVKVNCKYFFHESNADQYIWKNKPLFSYEDFIKWGNVPYERVIKKLAIERSEE